MTGGGFTIGWRAAIRPLLLNPRGTVTGVLSVALGVAVFLAISIANRGAVGSFHNAFAMVSGRADLEIRGRIPEALLPDVMRTEGVAAATPLVEAVVSLPDRPGETLHVAGIDPFTAPGLLGMESLSPDQGGIALDDWLGKENLLGVTRGFLTRHGVSTGDTVRLQGPGAPRLMTIRPGVKGGMVGEGEGDRVAAMDLAAAQEWIGTPGYLSAILIRLGNPSDRDRVTASLRARVPADVSVDAPARRTKQVDIMLSAFRLNLTALSLVSLLVGMFFVGNAAAAAVVRRRVSLGILRAVGTGRGTILRIILAEAGAVGLAGSLIGLFLAPVLAGILAAPVAQTVTALYLPVDAHGGLPTWTEALAGLLAGTGASLAAGWIPALQAAAVDPTRVLHPGAAREVFTMPSGKLFRRGCLMLVAAAVLSVIALHGGPALLGFGAAFCVLAGFSLTVPLVMTVASGMVTAALRHRGGAATQMRIALEQSMRSLHRTAPTVAALAAAVAMTVGISVMIHSFRGSVVAWTERTLTADLFIAPAANEVLGLVHTLPGTAAAWWAGRPRVQSVGTFREVEARSTAGDQVTLGVVAGPARGEIDFLDGDARRKNAALERGDGIALSESLARRLNMGVGGTLAIVSPRGPVSFRVIGTYRDYTRDRGIALIAEKIFRKSWGDPGVHSLAIAFRRGTTPGEMEEERKSFVAAFGGGEAFVCYGNKTLRERILEIFNQTFAVTSVLRAISIAVAVGGVMLTLGILVMERSRDIGVLRAMGASFSQIAGITLAEAGVIGALSSGIGLVSGSVLALVLTWVINKAFFGWSIDLAYPWTELAVLPLWMIVTSFAAGLFPAWRAARIAPSAALRTE